jgi:hypothetical protein
LPLEIGKFAFIDFNIDECAENILVDAFDLDQTAGARSLVDLYSYGHCLDNVGHLLDQFYRIPGRRKLAFGRSPLVLFGDDQHRVAAGRVEHPVPGIAVRHQVRENERGHGDKYLDPSGTLSVG